MHRFNRFLAVISAFALVASFGFGAEINTNAGTTVVTFETSEGEVSVYLPSDIARGDVVASRIDAPSALDGFAIVAGLDSAFVGEGVIRTDVALSSDVFTLSLMDDLGRSIDSAELSLAAAGPDR